MGLTENEIRKQICDFLFRFPERCLFTVNAKPRGKFVSKSWPPRGFPDLSGCWDGRALFIEVKTPTGTVYQPQIDFRDRAIKMGAIAFFATSVEDVRKHLNV